MDQARRRRRWKALEKARFKLVRTESSPPKRKPTKYTVKLKLTDQPLLSAFGAWSKTQLYGSFGYFELITGKIPKRITADVELVKNGLAFISLPDGGLVALHGGQVVFIDSEGGKPKTISSDLRTFLTKLSKGRTGVGDLDDKAVTGRKALSAWLAKQPIHSAQGRPG